MTSGSEHEYDFRVSGGDLYEPVLFVIMSALALSACNENQRTITVAGEGVAEAEPTHFSMTANLLSTGDSREEAARRAEATFQNVTQGLEALSGLEEIAVQSDAFIIGTQCEEEDRYRYEQRQRPCEAIAYVAQQRISVEGAPALLAGNAASLATELGAEEARISRYFLADMTDLERRAFAMASAAARERAEAVAASTDTRLGEVLEVIPEGLNRNFAAYRSALEGGDAESVRARDVAVEMSVRPAPVTYTATAYFTYKIEPSVDSEGD